MSVQNFIPVLWESRLLANFHEKSVADAITVPPTKIEGNKIVFNAVGDVAVKDYAGAVTFDTLSTSKVELNMDISKYFAFKVGDVDAVQAAGDLIDPHVQEASAGVQEILDKTVLDKGLTTKNVVAKGAGDKMYDVIVKLNLALNKNKVPKSNRFAVINSEVLADLNVDPRFTKEYVILENGILEGASINGCSIALSEELNEGNEAILCLYKGAIGYGKQINEMEALRLQDDFADGIRGLTVAGCTILREKAVAKYVKAAAK